MAWVKLHDEILGDPKLMRAARVGGAELVLLPWLLAFASKATDRGRLSVGVTPAEPEDIAYQIPGVTPTQVAAALRSLVAIGVLVADDDGCLRFGQWEERQAKPSQSKSAIRDRVRRSREAKRSRQGASNAAPALQGVTGSADAGPPAPDPDPVTPCNAPCNNIGNATEKRRGEEKREEEKNYLPRDARGGNGGCNAPPRAPRARSRPASPPVPDADVAAVLAHYRAAHPRRRPGAKDRAAIVRALGLGYTPAELQDAITGNAQDAWHRERAKHELPYVLRDNGQIDTFRERAAKARPAIVDGWFVDAAS